MEMESPDGVQWLVGHYLDKGQAVFGEDRLLPRVLGSNNWRIFPKA
jgi:hypothetical protein